MKNITLEELKSNPIGRSIVYRIPNLSKGNYALIKDLKDPKGRTAVFKQSSQDSNLYVPLGTTLNISFDTIKETDLIPSCPVTLGLHNLLDFPDALVFSI